MPERLLIASPQSGLSSFPLPATQGGMLTSHIMTMPTAPVLISIFSLLVALAALGLSSMVAILSRQLSKAQIRTELLTKLYGVQLDYERFNRRIGELRRSPPDPLPADLKTLLDAEPAFWKFEQDTALYRQALLGAKRGLSAQVLLTLQHHTDAMAKRTEEDNRRLDEILARANRP
jgi:hypothetical protein